MMKQKGLCEICSPKQWKTISSDMLLDSGYPVYGANGIIGYYSEFNHTERTLLITCRGATCGNLNICEPYSYINGNAMALDELSGDINIQYLYYYLQHRGFSDVITGSAQPQIVRQSLEKVQVVYPEIEQQRKIVASLDKLTALIHLRKQQLAKLDELVKSRFIEMFGDPMTNPMKWSIVSIGEVIGGRVSNGFFAKRDEYCDDGNVEVLGVANVVNRMYSNITDLPKTNAILTDKEKYRVQYGDMLFCRSSLVAEGIGKASIVPKSIPENVLFECHVIRVPLDLQKCVPEFMQVLSTTDYFRMQITAQSKTATMTTIGQDGILKSQIILPPIEVQQKFLSFVEQTNKSKLTVQESLDKLEVLKKALMQKYFG